MSRTRSRRPDDSSCCLHRLSGPNYSHSGRSRFAQDRPAQDIERPHGRMGLSPVGYARAYLDKCNISEAEYQLVSRQNTGSPQQSGKPLPAMPCRRASGYHITAGQHRLECSHRTAFSGPEEVDLGFAPDRRVGAMPRMHDDVEAASGASETSIERARARASPPGKSVRPTLPAKSVSPENSCSSPVGSRASKQMPPGVWPGVWSTRNSTSPAMNTSSSASSRVGAGARRSNPKSAAPLRSSLVTLAESASCIASGAPVSLDKLRNRPQVIEVAVREDDCLNRARANSLKYILRLVRGIDHDAPGPSASSPTTQQFVSRGPSTSLVTRISDLLGASAWPRQAASGAPRRPRLPLALHAEPHRGERGRPSRTGTACRRVRRDASSSMRR